MRKTEVTIVYTSNTGHTRQYALLLGEQIGLPVYSLDKATSQLSGGSPMIYLSWIHASHVSPENLADVLQWYREEQL